MCGQFNNALRLTLVTLACNNQIKTYFGALESYPMSITNNIYVKLLNLTIVIIHDPYNDVLAPSTLRISKQDLRGFNIKHINQ